MLHNRVADEIWIIILALSEGEGGLMPRHIIVAAELEAAVRKAVESIPKKDRVRPKEVKSKSICLSLACDPAPGKDACGMQSCASSSNALDEEIPHIKHARPPPFSSEPLWKHKLGLAELGPSPGLPEASVASRRVRHLC